MRAYLEADFTTGKSADQFLAKWHPRLRGGVSPRTARHVRKPELMESTKEKLAAALTEYEQLPKPGYLRAQQERFLGFVTSFDRALANGERETIAAAVRGWDAELEDARPAIRVAADGLLTRDSAPRSEAGREGRDLVVRAWLELYEHNVPDATATSIGRAKNRTEARARAVTLWEAERGQLERMIVRDAKTGDSPTVLADRYGLPRTTIDGKLRRLGER